MPDRFIPGDPLLKTHPNNSLGKTKIKKSVGLKARLADVPVFDLEIDFQSNLMIKSISVTETPVLLTFDS